MKRSLIIGAVAFAALVIVSVCIALFGTFSSQPLIDQIANPVSNTAVSPTSQSDQTQSEATGDETADDSTDQESETGQSGPTPNSINVNQLPDSSFLYDTDMAELTQADSYHDGQTVQVQGEVVGDCINDEADPSSCWITLQDNDDLNPLVVSVFMSRDLASVIDTYGGYNKVGTQLQVRGTFHLSCTEHQGMSDIHASVANVVEQGHHSENKVNAGVFVIAIVVALAGIALFLYYSFKSERSR